MEHTKARLLETRKKHLYPTLAPYYSDPIYLKKARGPRVWDETGREYLDAIGGIVSISVGHNHPRIVEKMKALLDEGAIQHTTHLYLSGHMENLAAKLAGVAPKELEKCFFTNSGSEANETAIMTARVATGEQMVAALRHAYHGGTNMTLGLCGHASWKYKCQPQTNVVHAAEPYCYRCPFGATRGSCQFECAQDIKNVIETATHGRVAAFIAEPIMGVGGFIDPPVEYHKKAYDIVKSFGGKYISDEVQTGAGRAGKFFFAIEESGVTPDIISMAKGFGSGAPIGAVIAKPETADAVAGKLQFNTFGGDPYQAMQAAEVIDIIKEENLLANVREQGEFLK
jgi:4-aminobutyrate aminotransferase-like enzyme